jgi:hypothetical protein
MLTDADAAPLRPLPLLLVLLDWCGSSVDAAELPHGCTLRGRDDGEFSHNLYIPNLQKRWGHVLTDPARSGREAPCAKRALWKLFRDFDAV